MKCKHFKLSEAFGGHMSTCRSDGNYAPDTLAPYNHKLNTSTWGEFKKTVEASGISDGDEFTSINISGNRNLKISKDLLSDEETILFSVEN